VPQQLAVRSSANDAMHDERLSDLTEIGESRNESRKGSIANSHWQNGPKDVNVPHRPIFLSH
jgi:hypothetical protein